MREGEEKKPWRDIQDANGKTLSEINDEKYKDNYHRSKYGDVYISQEQLDRGVEEIKNRWSGNPAPPPTPSPTPTTGGTEASGVPGNQTPGEGEGYTITESQLLADGENKLIINPSNEQYYTKVVNTPNGKVSVSPYIDPDTSKMMQKQDAQVNLTGNSNAQVNLTGDSNAQIEESLGKQPMYLADWGKLGAKGILNSRASVRDSIQDYFKWCQENNVKPDVQGLWMYADGQDMKKSGAQNQEDERKRKRYERNEQLGNFFMHLGDFVGSAGWGGPEQKIEDSKELTARQQKMRDAVEAKRKAYSTQFMNTMLQQKQMDDNERKMAIAEAKQDATAKMNDFRMDIERRRSDLQYLQYQRALEQDEAKRKQIEAQIEQKEKEYQLELKKFEEYKKKVEKELELRGRQLSIQQNHYANQDATAAAKAAEEARSHKASESIRREESKSKGKSGSKSGKSSEKQNHYTTEYDEAGNVAKITQYTYGDYNPQGKKAGNGGGAFGNAVKKNK